MLRKNRNRISAVLAAASVCCFTASVFSLKPMLTKGVEVHNDYLELKVNDSKGDTDYAGYILRKKSGAPLTYAQYCTSFAEVSINGNVKLYSEGETVKKPYTADDGSVITVQDFGGVEIRQKLAFTEGNTSNYDMLGIEYTVENKTEEDVSVTVRAVVDPAIADSEADPVVVDGVSYTEEKTFRGENVPKEWKLKDSKGEVAAYGITTLGSNAPDSFDIADWEDLFNDRMSYKAGGSVSDNAVAVTWSDKTVKAGDKYSVGTKYGLYSEAAGSGSNKVQSDSPKTGDKGALAFAGTGLIAAAAAVVFRRRRAEDDE
ncbi:MAG: LPXTG cell wall anchor domain-containing protein [Ruminococcus sp.]|nr:LPXTG cell wall anchor domain-containing protein [Ruminococcus sp.]